MHSSMTSPGWRLIYRNDRNRYPAKQAAMKPEGRKKPDPYCMDENNPEWTGEMFRRARPAIEAVPQVVEAQRRARGRPPKGFTKQQVTLRLSPQVLDYFRQQGRGWQTQIDDVLNRHVSRKRRREPIANR